MENKGERESGCCGANGAKNAVRIFCAYFSGEFPVWRTDAIVPVQAGKARTRLELGMPGDDTGDSISAKNSLYGELTAWYWVWRNAMDTVADDGFVGMCHYRRFIDFTHRGPHRNKRISQQAFAKILPKRYSEAALAKALDGLDIACLAPNRLKTGTMRTQFLKSHAEWRDAFERFADLVKARHPGREALIESVLDGPEIAFCLQFAMRKAIFAEFMDWTFSLAEEFEKSLPPVGERTDGTGRVVAFVVERFFLVWLALKRADNPGLRVGYFPLLRITEDTPWYYPLARAISHILPERFSLERRFDPRHPGTKA